MNLQGPIVALILLVSGTSEARAASDQDRLNAATSAWTRCVATITMQTAQGTVEQRLDQGFAGCVSQERDVDAVLQVAPADQRAGMKAKLHSAVRTALTTQISPTPLWQSLHSGMTPQEVVAALAAQKIRSVVEKGDNGGLYVVVKDRVEAAGRKAKLELGFVNDRLFFVDVRYEAPILSSSSERQIKALTGALAQKYGKPKRTSGPRVTHSSIAGIVQTESAEFHAGPLEVDLTVNTSILTSSLPSEFVIIRYWRTVDAENYAQSEQRRASQAEEEANKRLGKGL